MSNDKPAVPRSFMAVPEPATPLGRHRVLSPTAAVRVSPLCLGAMNFGDSMKDFLGECSKERTFEILDYFFENGGNFIDTANNYQNGESEIRIGEWLTSRGNRDEIVLATKYTSNISSTLAKKPHIQSNYTGNSFKSLRLSLENSLKNLQTDYIDLLYVHWWDFSISIPELMHSLHRVVDSGKVLYLGISDTPAWIVSKANEYARQKGLTPFVIYQGLWNASSRDLERDILPMCESEGMSLAPWGALGQGKFRTQAQKDAVTAEGAGRKFPPGLEATDKDAVVSDVLDKIAQRKGTEITSVALAYVRSAAPYMCFPIVGGRKVEHLKGNIEALKVRLTREEMEEIEAAVPFSYGFPNSFLMAGKKSSTRLGGADDVGLTRSACVLDVSPRLASVQDVVGC